MSDALSDLRAGGKPALSRALALIESRGRDPEIIALLDAAFADPKGQTLGLTGPPGVGKSTLVNCLIREARARGLSVGAIAVDPSSTRTGGALLGDRARLSALDPGDQGVFMRSLASRGRLGGVAALAYPSMVLMQAVFDLVLVETVGVGQSETEIAGIADAVMLCIQPASGDSLQFMKAGVMEIPDLAVVTKSDLGETARRAAADLRSALSVVNGGAMPVLLCSAEAGEGIGPLFDAFQAVLAKKMVSNSRSLQAKNWLRSAVLTSFGTEGLQAMGVFTTVDSMNTPFSAHENVYAALHNSLAGLDFSGLNTA